MAAVMDKFVYITGGMVEEEGSNAAAATEDIGPVSYRQQPVVALSDRFDTVRKVWETGPELNVARQGHSSCAIDDTVYVFCGCTRQGNMLF